MFNCPLGNFTNISNVLHDARTIYWIMFRSAHTNIHCQSPHTFWIAIKCPIKRREGGKRMSAKMSIEIKTKWEVNSQSELKKREQAMNILRNVHVALLVRIGVPTLHMPKKKVSASNFSYMCPSRGFTTALHTSIDGHGEKNRFKKIPAK